MSVTAILVLRASIEFSSISLIALQGLWMTSPAAILKRERERKKKTERKESLDPTSPLSQCESKDSARDSFSTDRLFDLESTC